MRISRLASISAVAFGLTLFAAHAQQQSATVDQQVDSLTAQAITNITLLGGQIKQDAKAELQMQASINDLSSQVAALKAKYEPAPAPAAAAAAGRTSR